MDEIPSSRINQIIDAVNRRYPKEAIGVRQSQDEEYYDSFWNDAEEHAVKYGFWPTFDMCEIESDDPVLDIYGGE